MDSENHLKNPTVNIEQNESLKIEDRWPRVNRKSPTRKQTFVKTVFSPTLKLVKVLYAAKPLTFSLHLLSKSDQNYHFNLISKIAKMCEKIFKNIAGRQPISCELDMRVV